MFATEIIEGEKYQLFICFYQLTQEKSHRVMKTKAPARTGMATTPLACVGDTESAMNSESGLVSHRPSGDHFFIIIVIHICVYSVVSFCFLQTVLPERAIVGDQ